MPYRPVPKHLPQEPSEESRMPCIRSHPAALALGFVAPILLAAAFTATSAHGQPWPAKPLRLVVPFPPGGGTDALARQFGGQLAETLGQPVSIDNRAGAGGNLGAEIAAKATADGYTLLFTSNSMVINAALGQKLNYNVATDLAPVALLASAPLVMAVHPALPIKSVREMMAVAKKRKGGLNFGSNGNGTSSHLAGELLRLSAGTELTHIPYKGAAPVIAALLGGELDMAFTTLISAMPHVRAGRLRVLAVTTPKASSVLPEAPPIGATYPGYEIDIWYGMFTPAGVAAPVQERLIAELRKGHAQPSVRQAMERDGAEAVWLAGSEFAAFVRRELDKYAKIVRLSGVKAE
jgi:tripartite-type tricarboxylate transporter receptor subunit TctC